MNNIDFTQTDGFPFDQSTMDFLQTMILTAAKTASLAGNLCILDGCIQSGSNVSAGYVVINNEILPFIGGPVQEKVVIVEEKENVTYYNNGTPLTRPSITKRHAAFGNDGITNYLWVNFKRNVQDAILSRLDRLERMAAPFVPITIDNVTHRGGMVLWRKPANLIPAGWAEVVDWRGRIPAGYDPLDPDFNIIGQTGGSKSRTLTIDNMPRHRHKSEIYGGNEDGSDGIADGSLTVQYHKLFDQYTDYQGNDQPFSILNPYRVVMFIEYVGE